MPLVTTAAGEAVTRGWTDGLPHSDHTPQSLATNTHTLLREGPTGHKTHQWRLSTSSHSNVTIKEKSRGQPPTSKWCLSALTPLSTLFIHPNIIFFFFYSFQSWLAMLCYHFFPFLSLPFLLFSVCFSSTFGWLPMTSFTLGLWRRGKKY